MASRWASSSALAAAARSARRPSLWVLSRSSSLARLRMPALRDTDPPVMEPPGFKTWPSRVTILKRWPNLRAMAMALSMSWATTTRPRRLLKIFAYWGSKEMRASPMPTKPRSRSTPRSRNSPGRMVDRGRKVHRPASRRLR